MRTILHIGLHKTGTTFLQKQLFPLIHERFSHVHFLCKPRLGLSLLNEGKWVEATCQIQQFKEEQLRHDCVNLISHECLSQDMLLHNYEDRFSFIREHFPDSEILLFLRYPTDWVVSLYKELVSLGKVYQPIHKYLVFDTDGDRKCAPSLSIENINYQKMISLYSEFYGPEKVHVFFYEDLINDSSRITSRICHLLDIKEKVCVDSSLRINRSMSALSIVLTNYISRRIPLKNECDITDMWWNVPWYKTKHYPWYIRFVVLVQKSCKALFFWNHWTTFTKGVLDRLVYIDWDLLKKHDLRQRLDALFKTQYEELYRRYSKMQ